MFESMKMTQGLGVIFANIERQQIAGSPSQQVDSYTLGIRTETFDRFGNSTGQSLGTGWGAALGLSIQFDVSFDW